MRERVTRPARAEIARASRLKKALESGAPPAFVPPDFHSATAIVSPHHASVSGSAQSEPSIRHLDDGNTRLQFLEQIFASSPEAFSINDCSHRVVWVNQAFLEMFGYDETEVIGQLLENLVVPPDRIDESRHAARVLARHERLTFETQRSRKNGTLLDVAMSCSPLFLDGKLAGFYAGYRDISDRKRVEDLSSALYRVAEQSSSATDLRQFFAAVHGILNELMHARNLYVALYDPATDMLNFPYFVDEQDSSPAPKKMGRGLTDYLIRTGEPLLATPEVLQTMQDRGEVERNGSRSLDWIGVPLKVGGHTFGALVVQTYSQNIRYGERHKEILTFVGRQIASAVEIKRNEQALRRSEARYRSLVQSSVYGIYRSSLEGRFLDVNPALIGMLGYGSAEEVLQLDPEKDIFAHPEEHERLIQEFRRTRRLDGMEVKWKRKDGNTVTVRISGRTVSSPDEPDDAEPDDVLEAIAEDVTERRVLEDQLRQAQKMEAVGRLAGGVAHDFNNLLMVIGGYSEVLLAGLPRENPLHEKGRAIQLAADRATTLTRQLLAFSRKQLLELKVVNVNAIVQDMERLLRPLIGENIELITKLATQAALTRADAGQLEQVLMNLVVNAKDAMPGGGKLTIRTQTTIVDDKHGSGPQFIRPGRYVMLSVSDTGLGMDRETQSRIFEPFFTTKEQGKGTGLGLSTVYGIVKQTGGYVIVQSEPGSGTTFHIYLPQAEGVAAEHKTISAPPVALSGTETILLVEDESSVRELVRDTLTAKGYKVVEAENGEAGLAAAAGVNGAIDLVITDVVMPAMGGQELARQLIAARPGIKVLYLSGYTEDTLVEQGLAENEAGFLQKPFSLHTLARKVKEILG
jgi:PAS domain S-box-containing protein